ncbi:MAG: amidohydrolase [Clostridia bacterium]|nr:amidohydrolase [Clostridia bacterium]
MKKIAAVVDKYSELILAAERYIWKNPETGYKEFKTSAYMKEKFEELGYEITEADGITGFYTNIDTGCEGPELLILAELDSIICPTHPDSDPITGAVHSCGHNAQCAALIGIAAALKEPGVLDGLCGKIRLCAVPAEELLEIDYRSKLKAEGKIKYFGGKSEFLSRGYFDGVDLAFMVHISNDGFTVDPGMLGCIAKSVEYKGKAAHAGGSPWEGCNALYAAACGINAVNAIRETFKDSNLIRVHPIITHGGDMVNAIPESVSLESYVRGRTFESIAEANKHMNRALIGGAVSLGANIDIKDIPGYAPLINAPGMIELCKEALEEAVPGTPLNISTEFRTGSTDMGDLSCIMPVVHPFAPGASGTSHGSDYSISDPQTACVTNAKWQLAMIKLLLENGAARAKKIIAEFKPRFASAKKYLAYVDSFDSSGDRIEYNDDGTASVILK